MARRPRPAAPASPRGISLRELRTYTARTQLEAAALVDMTQGELSKLERRQDFLLSTVRRYVEALGGTVDVVITLGSSSFHLTDGPSSPRELTMEDVRAAIDDLATLADWLEALLAPVARADLGSRRPGCGEFSLVEHVWHLRELDDVFFERVRRMIAEDRPALLDFDGERAASEGGYHARPITTAVRELIAARRRTVPALRKLDAKALARDADLEGVGRVTVAGLIGRWRAHDVGHRVEMTRLAASLP